MAATLALVTTLSATLVASLTVTLTAMNLTLTVTLTPGTLARIVSLLLGLPALQTPGLFAGILKHTGARATLFQQMVGPGGWNMIWVCGNMTVEVIFKATNALERFGTHWASVVHFARARFAA